MEIGKYLRVKCEEIFEYNRATSNFFVENMHLKDIILKKYEPKQKKNYLQIHFGHEANFPLSVNNNNVIIKIRIFI